MNASSSPAAAGSSVAFLLSHAAHARMWRRLRRVAAGFGSYEVLAFDRKSDPPAVIEPYISLGCISNGRYLHRLLHLHRAWQVTRDRLRRADAAYCFSLDLLLLAWIAGKVNRRPVRLVYEVADIRPLFTMDTPAAKLVRLLERWLVRHCAVVVMTSPDFYSGYFRRVQRLQEFPRVVIQHKPEVPREARDQLGLRARAPGTFRIGYFGLLKSRASFDLLCEVAARSPHLEIVFRGLFVPPLNSEECLARIAQLPNASYAGPYRSPEDLPEIYASVDLVWDAYTGTSNSQWQRTTRFSEAVFFKRPVITDAATPDGRLTREHGVGLEIDLDEPTAAVAAIGAISDADYQRWMAAALAVPEQMLFYGDEYRELLRYVTAGQR